jgi:hypothetical protein
MSLNKFLNDLGKTIRNSRRLGPNHAEAILDGLDKTVQKNSWQFCPKPSRLHFFPRESTNPTKQRAKGLDRSNGVHYDMFLIYIYIYIYI